MNLGGSAEQSKYVENDNLPVCHVKSTALNKSSTEAQEYYSTKIKLLLKLAASPTRVFSQGNTKDEEKKTKTATKTVLPALDPAASDS